MTTGRSPPPNTAPLTLYTGMVTRRLRTAQDAAIKLDNRIDAADQPSSTDGASRQRQDAVHQHARHRREDELTSMRQADLEGGGRIPSDDQVTCAGERTALNSRDAELGSELLRYCRLLCGVLAACSKDGDAHHPSRRRRRRRRRLLAEDAGAHPFRAKGVERARSANHRWPPFISSVASTSGTRFRPCSRGRARRNWNPLLRNGSLRSRCKRFHSMR